MKIIVAMAGTGNRFVDAGYSNPKPLIEANNKKLIEYIVEMFDIDDDEFVFICNESHMKSTNMLNILNKLVKNINIVTINNHKLGPVHTVNQALDHIKDDEEVIITYCDNPYIWNFDHFKTYVKNNKLDGCILSHIGFHPHRLSSTYMAYMRVQDNLVLEVKEKEPYTKNHLLEPASTGTYYFRKGSYIKKYFKQCVDENINFNGEYYVTLVYNLLIRDKLKVGVYNTDLVTVFGTPDELENFEAWCTIIKGSQVKNEEDLIDCYNYWKRYNAHAASSH
ncbi:MAG: NTP transferase domain-containing protein [Bacteroidetes bacterium]|nr:NTP transferase domain-containing protein [Bacteroidota bacterium]